MVLKPTPPERSDKPKNTPKEIAAAHIEAVNVRTKLKTLYARAKEIPGNKNFKKLKIKNWTLYVRPNNVIVVRPNQPSLRFGYVSVLFHLDSIPAGTVPPDTKGLKTLYYDDGKIQVGSASNYTKAAQVLMEFLRLNGY